MKDDETSPSFPNGKVARVTKAICANNFGGYCDGFGHDAHGCMVGYGEAPDWRNCKMTEEAMCLTAEYVMAEAALAALNTSTQSGASDEEG